MLLVCLRGMKRKSTRELALTRVFDEQGSKNQRKISEIQMANGDLQIRKISQRFQGFSLCKLIGKKIGQWGTTSPKNEKNGPESWLSERYNPLKFARLPEDAGMFPA